MRKSKSKKGSKQDAVFALPLPPNPPDLILPFAEIECKCDIDTLMPDGEVEPEIKEGLKSGRLAFRVGRCGRVLLDDVRDEAALSLKAEEGAVEGEAAQGPSTDDEPLQSRLAKLLLVV